MASPKKKEDSDWFSWALIVFLFLVELWPIALILLLAKLFGKDRNKELPPEKSPSQARAAAKRMTRSPIPKKSTARWLQIIGALVAVVGVLGALDPLDALFYSSDWIGLWLEDFLAGLAMAVAGIAMLGTGYFMDRQLGRFSKYLAVLGDRDAMPVEELARTLGYPERRTERDLQRMIDKGYFGGKAYLNVEMGYLFRSGEADQALRRQKIETPKEAEEGYSGILRKIRRANDCIADPILSAKIDRLEEIAAKIFRAVEADPKKLGRIDTFLNYYLPTTQKLLDSYAEFEAAGVEGENLRQAKQRIEATMDSIIRGFEHQLDELYQSDALDVDSDIRVMETMLRWDTASTEQDFGSTDQKQDA